MASTTSPADWFLEDVPGNSATPLIDGEAYFNEFGAHIDALGDAAAYLLLAGWRVYPEVLVRDPPETLRALIERTTERVNLRTRAMLWYVPGSIGNFSAAHGAENIAFADFVFNLGGEAILDNRVPRGRFASLQRNPGDVADITKQSA